MKFELYPVRQLPNGEILRVYPFHTSLEGHEQRVLCHSDEDYDAFVKIICVCSLRCNTILVMYSVVSNHAHFIVLAQDQKTADALGSEVKKMYSMYFSRKYSDPAVLKRTDSKALLIDSEWYLRNAIAYDIRNAMDNGAKNIQSYKWTGFGALFCEHVSLSGNRPTEHVSSLSKRRRREIMRTDDDLSTVGWMLDSDGHLIPATICDRHYAEAAFGHDQAFLLRIIGSVNCGEMQSRLVDGPRQMKTDAEMLRLVEDICRRWFGVGVHELPIEKKARVLAYVNRTSRTSEPQLARVFELSREVVARLLGRKE